MISYSLVLLLGGLAVTSPAIANTDPWEKVERELVHYLAVKQDTQLARWEQIVSKSADRNSDAKLKILAAGRAEILRLTSDRKEIAWQNQAVKRLVYYLRTNHTTEDYQLSEQDQGDLQKYLWSQHPDPRALTALEWKAIGLLYGNEVRNSFFLSVFSSERWSIRGLASAKSALEGNTAEVVFIEDNYHWNSAGKNMQTVLKNIPPTNALQPGMERLKSFGIKVHKILLSPFPNIEDQAHELEHSMEVLRQKTKAPLVILSSGISSAVVYRWLDLHPENRDREDIRAWINYNGRLYGISADDRAEKVLRNAEKNLARSRSPAAETEWEMAAGIFTPQKETANAPIPLGPGFPIFNFVTLAKQNRPPENIREAVVPEGKVLVANEPWDSHDLPTLLHRALNP